MRGEQHKNARMETSQHGKNVLEEFSRGGLYLVRTWKDCKGQRHEGKRRQPTTNLGEICLKNIANKREHLNPKINLKVAVERWRL